MKKIHIILVLLFAFVALACTNGVASAGLSTKYVGNTMVDLSWTQYESTDFSKYELCRDGVPITTITNRTVTFYRDAGLTKGNTYGYEMRIYNATGVLKGTSATGATTTGEVRGTITIDTTWTAASSPYTLTGDVDVRDGTTLIASGVMVKGNPSYYVDVDIIDSQADIKNCIFDAVSIYLHNSNNNNITGNNISNTFPWGIHLSRSSNNNITGNNVSNNCGDGIFLCHSSYNHITGNNVSNNRPWGINLYNSSNNNITGNNVSNHRGYGIHLSRSSNNNVITANTASNNSRGIYLYNSSNNNVITANTASNNFRGICIGYCANNTIYNNYFNNTNNAYDNGNNTWSSPPTGGPNIVGGPYIGGNYWSDYNGTNSDADMFGDTELPYNCSGGIKNGGDYHPLVTIRSYIVTTANNQVGEHYLWGAEGQIPDDGGGEVIMATPYGEPIVGHEIAHHTAKETTEGSHYCSGRHSEVTGLTPGNPDNKTHQANYRKYSWQRYDWRCKAWVYGEACEGHRHFDCSGLVYFVYNQAGVPLVRTTVAVYAGMDTDIARTDLKPGDVCYRGRKHIGIYVGGNRITHAAGHDKGVITTPLDNSWNGFGRLLPPELDP